MDFGKDWSPISPTLFVGPLPPLPRSRLTIRRLMIVVAVVALAMFGVKTVGWILEGIDEAINEPFGAVTNATKTWNLGPTPTIVIDCFEGTIQVFPSADGQVTAEVSSVTLAENTRSAAAEGLKTIDVSFDQHGDTLRIVARGASGYEVRKEAHVSLYVPKNVRLDLRTGRGDIRLGWGYKNNAPEYLPITAYSVRARNDSKYRSGYAEGNIRIATTAPRSPGSPATPTRLQLDAPGRIEVNADLATVAAYAWHGTPHEAWSPAAYEDGLEGTILFEGALADGAHSLRAAHRVELKLAASTSLQIQAEATPGGLAGSLLPQTVAPVEGKTKWSGTVGVDPRSTLNLRVDDGSILADRRP